jgi:hypothetical protein
MFVVGLKEKLIGDNADARDAFEMCFALEADGFQRDHERCVQCDQLFSVQTIFGFINVAIEVVAGVNFVASVGNNEVFDETDAEDLIGGVVHFHEIEGSIERDL